MSTESNNVMASIRNVVARLAPVKSLTSRLPRFSESLVNNSASNNLAQGLPTSISWTKYAVDGQYTSVSDLLKLRRGAKVIAIGEHHNQ